LQTIVGQGNEIRAGLIGASILPEHRPAEPELEIREVPATLLAAKVGVNRSRLSNIERGYIQPTEEEMERLHASLAQLITAKAVIQRAAASVGWPTAGVG
jgi:transcriptional regulator with XRE-family HTH domain